MKKNSNKENPITDIIRTKTNLPDKEVFALAEAIAKMLVEKAESVEHLFDMDEDEENQPMAVTLDSLFIKH